ncbi:hypothetical protein ACLQ18_02160 [Streptomyces sp. DT193]|uniref:hypothetical protein n=1 Tax=Streptomyces sp. DT193 TaxID=3393418 RepID=UPI003CF8DF2B
MCLTLLTACGGQARDADGRTPSTTKSKTASPSPSAKAGAWKVAYSSKADNAELRALSVASDRDAWAVGAAGDDWDKTFFVHYDGRQWRDYDAAADLPKLSGPAQVELASSGPGNTWFFGTDNPAGTRGVDPVIAHWDGSRWEGRPTGRDQMSWSLPVAPDGAQGLLFPRTRLRADGTYESIGTMPLILGKTGEITDFDRAQKSALTDLVQVPDTHEVWGAGSIAAGGGGSELDFSHGIVVVYEAPGG